VPGAVLKACGGIKDRRSLAGPMMPRIRAGRGNR